MGHAVHQVLIELAAQALGSGVLLRGGAVVMVDGSLAVNDFANQLLRFVDTVGHRNPQHGLAVKPGQIHVLVGGDDDAVTPGDLLFCQDVLGAAGALGLRLHADVHLPALLLQSLCGHVGVGDARGAGGDGQHPEPSGVLRGSGGRLVGVLEPLLGIDQAQECLRVLRLQQFLAERPVHQHNHQPGEHLQVYVAAGLGSRDHKKELGGQSVGSFVVHPVGDGDGRQPRLLHGGTLGVGYRDAVSDGGGAQGFSGQDVGFVEFPVGEAARPVLEADQQVDGLVLAGRCGVELDAFGVQQIGNTHGRDFLS